jgi:hypothetical protein
MSRATVSEVMLAYMTHGKTTSVNGNNGQKSALTKGLFTLRRIVSRHHRTTGEQAIAEMNKICPI